MKTELIAQIDTWIQKVKDEYISDVLGAINIPSVSLPDDSGYPFGKNCAKMLDYMQQRAEAYGFSYTNHEYQCGSVLLNGSDGAKEIALIGHTDVVPAGKGWHEDPFCGKVIDGYFVGRGSNDNKGSVMAAMYAARFIMEQGIPLKNNLRVIFGSDEEEGMRDIKYFYANHPASDVALVVDSWFPISASEKGNMSCGFTAKVRDGNLESFVSKESNITIPNTAQCVLSGVSLQQVQSLIQPQDAVEAESCENGVRITAHGVGKIVFFPDGSVNAIAVLTDFLLKNNLVTGEAVQVLEFIRQVLQDHDGKSININYNDPFAGKTIHALTYIDYERGKDMYMEVHCGPPALKELDYDVVFEEFLDNFRKPFLTIVKTSNSKPHLADMDSPVIDILCENSALVLGGEQKPFAQWGGTDTWHVPNSFAAGPADHNRPQSLFKQPGFGGAHEPDECMEIEVLLRGIKIYILSILDIDRVL